MREEINLISAEEAREESARYKKQIELELQAKMAEAERQKPFDFKRILDKVVKDIEEEIIKGDTYSSTLFTREDVTKCVSIYSTLNEVVKFLKEMGYEAKIDEYSGAWYRKSGKYAHINVYWGK